MLLRFPSGVPQGPFRPLALEDVPAQLLVRARELRRTDADRLLQPFLMVAQRLLRHLPSADVQREERVQDSEEDEGASPGQDHLPVAGVGRLGEVDHRAPLGEPGGRDPPPDELEVVEQVPPREVPHDGDRRRVFSSKDSERDPPGRLPLVESARQLSADEAEPEVEIPRTIDGASTPGRRGSCSRRSRRPGPLRPANRT